MPLTERRTTLLATLALLAMTACWGSTFYLIHDLLDRVPVVDFLAVRFAIASAAILLVAPRAIGRLSRDKRRHAVVLGLLYGVAQILQTAGLAHTAASVSGFITGMYVVCTPLFAAVLLHTRIGAMTWVGGAARDRAGSACSPWATSAASPLGYGEALTLVAALLYALHIVGLGAWSTASDALGHVDHPVPGDRRDLHGRGRPGRHRAARPARRLGSPWSTWRVFAGAAALLGQTWAQAHLPPTRSAIIMSMEPVFAAVFAVLLGGESATSRMLLGGGAGAGRDAARRARPAPQDRGRGHPHRGVTATVIPHAGTSIRHADT